MADKPVPPEDDRFAQPLKAIRIVPKGESFRDLTPKQRRDRLRGMYRDLLPEEEPK